MKEGVLQQWCCPHCRQRVFDAVDKPQACCEFRGWCRHCKRDYSSLDVVPKVLNNHSPKLSVAAQLLERLHA